MWGVEVKGLSVSAVSRKSRRGRDLFYFSVIGPVGVMRSLHAKSKWLNEAKSKWDEVMGFHVRETRDGVGVPTGPSRMGRRVQVGNGFREIWWGFINVQGLKIKQKLADRTKYGYIGTSGDVAIA